MLHTGSYSKLTVNADDFGRDKATCDAVVDGFRNGVINSASFMAIGDAFEYGVKLAKKHKLPIGIHVVLSREKSAAWKPLTGSRELVGDDGLFFHNAHEIYAEHHETVRDEVKAQAEKIVASGLKPKFFDAHQYGLSHFDGRFNSSVSMLQEYGIPFVYFRKWHLMSQPILARSIYGGKSVTGKSPKGMVDRLSKRIGDPDSRWLALHVSTDKKNELYRTWMLDAVKSKEVKDAYKNRKVK